jgi:hypothetical protein
MTPPIKDGGLAAVARAARAAGLFLLVEKGVWKFMSATTAYTVLCWFESDGDWTTPGARQGRGKADGPFAALKVARRLARDETRPSSPETE